MKWIGLIATGFIFALAIWFSVDYVRQKSIEPDIRLVITSWPTGQLMRAVEQLGYFSEQGIKVDIIDARDNYSEVVSVLDRGEAEAGVFVLSEPILMSMNNHPMQVVLGLDYSSGADGLVVSPEITNLSDLKNKVIAYQPGSFGDLLLQQALDSANLTTENIISRNLTPADASQAFLLGEVDAAVTVEPFLSQALIRNGSKVIFSSKESPGLLPDIVAFDASFVKNNPVLVASFVKAWFNFKRDMDSNEQIRKQAVSIVAIRLGETLSSVENEFKGIHILTEEETKQAFSKESSAVSLYDSGYKFLQFFKSRLGLDTENISLDNILNDEFINIE